MEKLTKLAQKIVDAFVKEGHDDITLCGGEGLDDCVKWDPETDPIVDSIHDDDERDQWEVGLRFEGLDQTRTVQVLTKVLGSPSRDLKDRGDGVRVVNWDVKGVTLVQTGNELEMYLDYRKVSK